MGLSRYTQPDPDPGLQIDCLNLHRPLRLPPKIADAPAARSAAVVKTRELESRKNSKKQRLLPNFRHESRKSR